jgi:hypothetical protein
MRQSDPSICRRALHDIGAIAAVAVLENSQMTEQEALQAIAAIADRVAGEAPGARADGGDVIRQIGGLTARGTLEALDDRAALYLFARVIETLADDRTAGPGGSADERGGAFAESPSAASGG